MAQDPRALLQKAQKALQGAGGGFSFFGGREEKYQNAADMFIQAANAFKMQKQSTEAPVVASGTKVGDVQVSSNT